MKNCFIIINYNDAKSTKHLLKNIKNFKNIDHILIYDNNSSEEEVEQLKSINNDKVEIIYGEENIGYSKAINKSCKYLNEKYGEINFIISNPDIVIMSEEDLNRMIDLLNNELIGIIGPQVLEKGSISRGWKNISPMKDFFMNMPLFRKIVENKLNYSDNYYENEISSVDVIGSCFFMISSTTMKDIGYMDENVFLYYEDYVLCKKIKNLGLLVAIYNNVKVKHMNNNIMGNKVNKIGEYKLLLNSQMYYHTKYNDANGFEKLLLKISYHVIMIFANIFK